MLGFIRRNTTELSDITALRTLYLTLVRPTLLYASIIWSPYYEVYSKNLEKIQHKFLNHAAWKLKLPSPRISHNYNDIAINLDISSLQSHRIYNDHLFIFKLLTNELESSELLSRVNWKIAICNTRISERTTFAIPTARTNLGMNAPMTRMFTLANNSHIDMSNLTLLKFINSSKLLYLNDYR